MAQAVEKRSYSRISGETSLDSVIGTPGQMFGQDLAGAAFMRRVGEAVQETDRDRLDPLGHEALGERGHARFVERRQHPALRVDALAHREAQPARHQGRRQVDVDVVLLEAVLVPDLDRVAKALGGDERGFGALALDQRVGRQGRAVDDDREVGRGQRRLAQHLVDRRDDGALGRLRRRQDLGAPPPLAHFERHIGKGAADVDAQSRTLCHPIAPRPSRARVFGALGATVNPRAASGADKRRRRRL